MFRLLRAPGNTDPSLTLTSGCVRAVPLASLELHRYRGYTEGKVLDWHVTSYLAILGYFWWWGLCIQLFSYSVFLGQNMS